MDGDLDPGVLAGFVQKGPDPVGPQEDSLFGGHGGAVEGVSHVEADRLSDVGHQEDLERETKSGFGKSLFN